MMSVRVVWDNLQFAGNGKLRSLVLAAGSATMCRSVKVTEIASALRALHLGSRLAMLCVQSYVP